MRIIDTSRGSGNEAAPAASGENPALTLAAAAALATGPSSAAPC